jgi:acyl-CoA thioester hydrolase
VFEFPVSVRYLEVDQQGVVFNMWYLAYLDDALTAYLAHHGMAYGGMMAEGFDVQLVHTELDWRGGVGFGDRVTVAVALARVGRTSFTLDFEVRRDGQAVVSARTVYVVIATDGTGKQPIPPFVRAALGEIAPLRPV